MANPTVEAIEDQTETLTAKFNELHADLLLLNKSVEQIQRILIWQGSSSPELTSSNLSKE